MTLLIEFFEKVITDRRGATAIEYALIGSLVAVLIVAAVGATGESVEGIYTAIATTILNSTN